MRDFSTSTRRTFLGTAALAAAAATGACGSVKGSKPLNVSIDHVNAPRVTIPPRSCDCHVHVFDPRFPLIPERTYTPGPATVDDLLAFERRIGFERVVVVQPSGYGSDNRCLVDSLQQLGVRRARGVAVVDPLKVTAAEIDALHAAGVRSIRLNLEVRGEHNADRAKATLRQALEVVAGPKWSIQIYADLGLITQVSDTIAQAKSPIVLDHFAGLKAERGLEQPGFAGLLSLLKGGQVYVKLSAPYRASSQAGYANLAPFAQALIEAAPDRMLWASDWPHTGSSSNRGGDLSRIEPYRTIDDGAVLDLLPTWAPDAASRRRILVDNPARL